MAKEYIERETAKKVLADDYAYNAAKLLDIVPAADVQEVRHGEWLPRHYEDSLLGFNNYDECSLCGYERNIDDAQFKTIYKHCPECGAKMDEEFEE